MDSGSPERPMVQVDNEVRPMTDDEYELWVSTVSSKSGAPEEWQPE